ncbi:winged helix-turn-helix domain-containing protein [Pseudomonas sp. MRSN 12121]|uniref:ATP-binding protein n=1 Tax=Pseudomonas sp. MRSN 12121 TaxID=1611770 RepID=UPI0005BEBF52|nr:winged helix-turn-helix domain-containing protein [Pseudomonas sp. MRSN 12121]AJO79176.1 transcriptional regulator [Pseudomonas sp. MRSN 12121]
MNGIRDLNSDEVLRFGPYVFHPRRRLVLEGDRPLGVGGRALEILRVLLERAGEVLGKEELIARVWPHSVVEEINLRVHIAALRRALGDGRDGQRYIVTLAQRGYCFTAPVRREPLGVAQPLDALPQVRHNLPARLTPVVGRDALVASLVGQLPVRRWLTLVGPAGIGKSTVALRVAEHLLPHYRDGAWRVDLAALDDPAQVAAQVARVLRLEAGLDALAARHLLLVLDNGEHLLDACRVLVEQWLALAPQLSILVTSREPLGLPGETLHVLPALSVPPAAELYSVAEVMGHSAVQLFVSRARACQQGFVLREQDLHAVCDICRRLDGLPLAIELAAAQIDALALVGLQAQLDNCFQLLTQGRRTAVARHQTLKSALDWSYRDLDPLERSVLQGLAVFKVAFTLEAAIGVISCAVLLPELVAQALQRLVEKSLLAVVRGDGPVRYRLLNTTRTYAREKLEQGGLLRMFEVRQARYISRARRVLDGKRALQLVEQ